MLPEIWANVIQHASQAFSVAGQVLRYFPYTWEVGF